MSVTTFLERVPRQVLALILLAGSILAFVNEISAFFTQNLHVVHTPYSIIASLLITIGCLVFSKGEKRLSLKIGSGLTALGAVLVGLLPTLFNTIDNRLLTLGVVGFLVGAVSIGRHARTLGTPRWIFLALTIIGVITFFVPGNDSLMLARAGSVPVLVGLILVASVYFAKNPARNE